MKLKWREKDYNFTPRVLTAEKDKDGAGAKVTIDANIYAFDTESVALPDRYEPICFQTSSDFLGESLIYLPERAKALDIFLENFIRTYSYIEFENHYCFMYAHNLLYDWLQLIKGYPDLLSIARTGLGFKEDYEIYRKEDYQVILRKGGLFVGNAPHFTIKVKLSKREWVDIMFRDTFSFFPVSLSKISKDLKLDEGKLERDDDLGKVDYRILSDDDPKKIYFERYAKRDPLATRLTAEKIRELHKRAGMNRIRVSSPGYAINKLYHSVPEGTQIKSGDESPETMQLIMDSYAGGRTGGVYHGKVENISVLDFHSSYPASMLSLPSFAPSMAYIDYPEPEKMTTEELLGIIDECHCFMNVDGEETDEKYPAIITSRKGKLTPVYGKFENMATTGVEVSVGIRSGTLRIDKINKLVCLVEMEEPEVLPFKEFVLDAYQRKASSEKESVDYLSAKLELNSSYGKLIESRTETPVADDVGDIVLPYVEDMETDFGHMYYKEYIETLREESEKTFEEVYPDLMEKILSEFPEEVIKYANFKKLSLTELTYGRYVVPAGASLVTATSRARLLAVMKITSALYWDTDSVFIKDYDKDSINKKLEVATKWLPPFVVPLRIGDELGELDCEIENASGYLAGTKRYYLETPKIYKDKKTGELISKTKRALHGIPTAPFDMASDMIKSLATGENFKYEGRQRPKGVKETKDSKEIGRFFSRKFESQFHLDNRLEWVESGSGWVGVVKSISEMGEKKS